MDALEALLDVAKTRALTKAEHEDLVAEAEMQGAEAIKIVALRLAMSGTYGVMNLRAAMGLRAAHARVMAAAQRDLLDVRAADRALIVHASFEGKVCDVSTHAIEQYIRRVRTDLGYDAAREVLCEEIRRASPMKARTLSGHEQWRLPQGGVAVIRRGGTVGCVTVLSEADNTQPDRSPPAHRAEKRSGRYGR